MEAKKIESKKENETEYEGNVSISKEIDAYVRVPALEWESVFVPHAEIHTALQGDKVKVVLTGETRMDGQKIGKIIQIVNRSKKLHTGTLEVIDGVYSLHTSDKKTYITILIKKGDEMGAEPKSKIAVELGEWKDDMTVWATVVRVLGKPGDNNAEMLAYALERGFSDEHKESVAQEARDIKQRGILEEDKQGRMDYREVLTFTIDPADAQDFDDAISFKYITSGEHTGRYEVGIHIADVSYYVKNGGALDIEAIERQTSVYLVDRCVPMLPEELSNDLCSLVEGKDRLVMSAIFVIDDEGTVYDKKFGRCVINSAKRFTYENAQETMDKNDEVLHSKELHILNNIAKKLYKLRFDAGALSLDSEEVKFKLDENGKPVDVYIKVRGDTNKMIEEWMLLANREVSYFITKSQTISKPICVYRVHDKPDPERMHDLDLFIRALGEKVQFIDGAIPSSDLNALLIRMVNRPEKDLLQVHITRSMAKAAYSTDNVGHYGLAFEYYSHFTSPIRRYPDVLTHRLLQRILDHDMPKQEEKAPLQKLCIHASMREKDAADAERGSIKYKQVEYMMDRIGQSFTGVISGVSKWGVFVEEKKSKCEGMIRLRDLGTDFYNFDEAHQRIIGERSGEDFKIGDRIQIKVKMADLENKQIDYQRVK